MAESTADYAHTTATAPHRPAAAAFAPWPLAARERMSGWLSERPHVLLVLVLASGR